jgi:NAD-dependent deacetylase
MKCVKKVVVLTGAGISAESGIRTFRDGDGLWENHRIEDVATPAAWHRNPTLVLDFYNLRRRQLKSVSPNDGHFALVQLETSYSVQIITQNVDDLHERAGSSRVLHLHGSLRQARSTGPSEKIYEWQEDLNIGDYCTDGYQLRPHIVWFGEAVPLLETAAEIAWEADIFLIVGTSLQVYPAASLMEYARPDIPYYYVDPHPQVNYSLRHMANLTILPEMAGTGLPRLVQSLLLQEKE